MPGKKGKFLERWNYGLIISALLIVILTAGFQTLRLAWFRVTNNFFYPYLNYPAQAGYISADESTRLYSKRELASKIKELETDQRIYASKVARLGELTVENEKLRSLFKLPKRSDYNYITAEIILRDPLRWKEGFTVSCGSSNGIVKGTPVLSFSPLYPNKVILVGIVKEASKHSAQVITVLNPQFRISCYLTKADTHGIINGDNRQGLKSDLINVSFLSTRKKYHAGEECLTSGFEHQIPAGFLIGNFKKLDTKNQFYSNELYLTARIIPAVQLDNLHFVVLAVPTHKRTL